MKRFLILVLAAIFFPSIVLAQNACLEDFQFAVHKIEKDYPGYLDKTRGSKAEELLQLKGELMTRLQAEPDSCAVFIDRYVAWFNDHHLRLLSPQRARPTVPEKEKMPLRTIAVDNIKTLPNSIEGLWKTFRGDMLIRKVSPQTYEAISINLPGQPKGQLLHVIQRTKTKQFEIKEGTTSRPIFVSDNHRILEIYQDQYFVKSTGNALEDKTLLYSYIPRQPAGLNAFPLALPLSDNTFYLRIPSFGTNTADQLYEKHKNDILTRPCLIIDLRNNGGGQDEFYQVLSPLLYTQALDIKGVEWYATQGNIDYWERLLANNQIKEGKETVTRQFIDSMKNHIGQFILHPEDGHDSRLEMDSVLPFPKKIGIIINRHNASSAEQFLLEAKESKKVTLFGSENTSGTLDYSNCLQIDLPSQQYKLVFPFTRSRRLPDRPIDETGIAPDVLIPLESNDQLYDRLDDWVYYVKNYLEQLKDSQGQDQK